MTALILPPQAAPESINGYAAGSYYDPAMAAISGTMQGSISPVSAALQHLEKADFPSGQAPDQVQQQNDSGRSYTILKEVGDGSFGTVWLADWHSPLSLPPNTRPPGPSNRAEYKGKNLVAIKRMKKAFHGGWDECLKLKELHSLRTIPIHPNIIPLYDAFLMPSTRELYFVFECMEGNLYQLTKSRKMRPLAGGLVATLFYQMLSGLHHIHSSGFFHRDMKPENVLITTTGLADYPCGSPARLTGLTFEKDVEVIVKLADFGLARETRSKPPYTEYVSTRWYRAPEVLLRDREYSNPVDMWALGTILAEMVTLKPLFPGGTEVDQVHRICEVLGDPSEAYVHSNGLPRGGGAWHRGVKIARLVHFEFQPMPPIDFRTLFDLRIVPIQLVDCIFLLLRFDPNLRLTTSQCLQHPYFSDVAARLHPVSPAMQQQLPITPNSSNGYAATPQYMAQPGQVALLSPPQSGVIDPTASRPLPPSHSHGTPVPTPEYGQPNGLYRSNASFSSASSQQSQAAVPLYRRTSESGSDSWRQSMPRSVFSDTWQSSSSNPANQLGAGPLPMPAPRQPRLSTAVSTFYDGSIFEGIAPTRDASIMSFNMYGPAQDSAAARYAAAYTQRQVPSGITIYDEQSAPPQAGPSAGARSQHLKRTPSDRSQDAPEPPAAVQAPLDPKQAKKAAKEAERAKREAASKAARERARAVMQKKSQLEQKAVASGQAADALNILRPTPGKVSEMPGADKGKNRAISTLPNIAEHEYGSASSRTQHGRFKARRRDDDDDVHSVSSNETRNSGERLKTGNTGRSVDSDPGRPSWPVYHPHLLPRSSLSGLNLQGRPPGSSSSSVDDRLAGRFQNLLAAEPVGMEQLSESAAMSAAMVAPGVQSRYFGGGVNGQTLLPFLPQMAYPPDPGKTIPSYQLSYSSNAQPGGQQ